MFQLPFDPPATQHFVFALSPRAKLKLAKARGEREGGRRGLPTTRSERERERERERAGASDCARA